MSSLTWTTCESFVDVTDEALLFAYRISFITATAPGNLTHATSLRPSFHQSPQAISHRQDRLMTVEGSRLPADLPTISPGRAVHVSRGCDRAEDIE